MNTRVQSKSFKFISCLEKLISHNLQDAGILTRPVKGNGLWCHCLIPIILILDCITNETSLAYRLTAYVSIAIVLYSMLFIVFTSVSSLVLKESEYGGSSATSLISALIIYCLLDYGIIVSFVITLPTIWLYSALLRHILHKCPKTFTFGEAMVTTQAIVLTTFMSLAKLLIGDASQFDFVDTTIYIFLLTVAAMSVVTLNLKESMRNTKILCLIVAAGAVVCVIALMSALGINFLVALLHFLFRDNELRVKIMLGWLSFSIMAVLIVYYRTRLGQKADTVTRKSFHVLGSFVFLTGILFDMDLMRLAAGLVFGLIIFLEVLRHADIEPISSALQSAFAIYSDEKDGGELAMTPLYLYCGLWAPLAIAREPLLALSGVLAVGVGDTAASWFGSRYGLHRWEGTECTLEGTSFYILSQVFVVYILQSLEILDARYLILRTTIAALITGVIEAKTDQVDNLVLPLLTIIVFQITSLL